MTQHALIQHTIPLHPALPEEMRRRLSGRAISRPIPRSVRARLRQPEDITIAEAAAKYRRVTPVDAKPGPWRNDLVPHAVEAMNLFQQPWIKEIWLCWPERTAKTNVMLNCAAAAVRGVRHLTPGNIFWLEPAEDDTNIKTKIIPMFRESPGLKKFLSTRADDTGKKLITFKHGVNLFPASANSARTMANYFGKYCFCNEPDKYPVMVGSETDPIKLIRKRGRDVRNSKLMFGSTPAGRFIYKGTMACQQVLELHNRCPHCGDLILMDDDHLVIPPGATAEQVESAEVPVGYACNACGAEWDEFDRERAYQMCRFVATKGADVKKPLTVGLHASALPFPMIPLAETAGKYLRSKNGDHADKVDYAHGYKVIDYEEEKVTRKEDEVLRLIDPHMPRGIVPRDINSLLILADTQRIGFYYEIVAYGWGRDLETWIVDHGYVEQFDHLNKLAEREWYDADGGLYRCRAGFIDSGGGTDPHHPKHSRTREVYDFCIDHPFWSPLKGKQRQSSMVSWSRLDFYPGKDGQKVAIPSGLLLYTLDTTQYKNMVERKMLIDPDNPGAMHLHAGLTTEEMETWSGPHSAVREGRDRWQDYSRQMCAEFKDERGLWECLPGRANHHFDLAVYRYAAADILMLADERREDHEQQMQPEPETRPRAATHTQTKRRRW